MARNRRTPVDDSAMVDDARYMELKEAQQINVSTEGLNYALMTQPQLIGNVAVGCALAIQERDMAKHQIDLVEAALDRDLREQLTQDNEKFTETRLAALIKLEPEYQQAYKRYFDAKYRADCWEGLRESYKTRGYSIRDVINLRHVDYLGEQLGSDDRTAAGQRSLERRVRLR